MKRLVLFLFGIGISFIAALYVGPRVVISMSDESQRDEIIVKMYQAWYIPNEFIPEMDILREMRGAEPSAAADSSAVDSSSIKSSGRVRFVIARDHSGSVSEKVLKTTHDIMNRIASAVTGSNLLTFVEFGSDVHVLGTADGETERLQLLNALERFTPTLHWQYDGYRDRIDIDRPGDIAFTNFTKLFDVLTEDAMLSVERDGDLVCIIVMTDGDWDPPHRRGQKRYYLEDEKAKTRRIRGRIDSIKAQYPNNVIVRVIEVGDEIKSPGFVVNKLLQGYGQTVQANDWAGIEPIIKDLQRRIQGTYRLEVEPKRIPVPIAGEENPSRVGQIRFHMSGPDSGYFAVSALASGTMLVDNHRLFGNVQVNDGGFVPFTGTLVLRDGDLLTFRLYENPGGGFGRNWFMTSGGDYNISLYPASGMNPVSFNAAGDTEQPVSMYRYGWFVEYGLTLVLGGTGFVFLFLVWVFLRAAKNRRRKNRKNKERDETAGNTPMFGEVELNGQHHQLDTTTSTVGDMDFEGRDSRVYCKPQNDAEIIHRGQRTRVRAGHLSLLSNRDASEIRDTATDIIYIYRPESTLTADTSDTEEDEGNE